MELERLWEAVVAANRPTVQIGPVAGALARAARIPFPDAGGAERPLLTEAEISLLSIPKGSLSDAERREIESHVTHTYRFLARIPWTRTLRRIPEIAWAHHEKLDGGGYPRGIPGEAIPVEARMMTIADIYDALTASDRPYKRAVPPERALEILDEESRLGRVDAALLGVFVEAGVWRGAVR